MLCCQRAQAVARSIMDTFVMLTVPAEDVQPGGVPLGPGPQPSQAPETVMLHCPVSCAIVNLDCSPEGEV